MSRMLLAGVLAAAAGCGYAPARVPVSGTVTLDGLPLSDATITLAPATGDGPPPDRGPVAGGRFAFPAAVGKRRVEVYAYRAVVPAPPPPNEAMQNYIPDRYNGATTLSAEVTPAGPNEFRFELTSR